MWRGRELRRGFDDQIRLEFLPQGGGSSTRDPTKAVHARTSCTALDSALRRRKSARVSRAHAHDDCDDDRDCEHAEKELAFDVHQIA